MAEPLDKLTTRQRDCLRLVLQHMQSKEIARHLGISPTTVDNHLRSAIQTLGVGSRVEAARLLAAHESGASGQSLTSQSRRYAVADEDAIMPTPAIGGELQGGMSLRDEQVAYRGHVGISGSVPLPFPTAARPRNDLTVAQRLTWIGLIIAAVGLGTGVLLAGLAVLSDIALALAH